MSKEEIIEAAAEAAWRKAAETATEATEAAWRQAAAEDAKKAAEDAKKRSIDQMSKEEVNRLIEAVAEVVWEKATELKAAEVAIWRKVAVTATAATEKAAEVIKAAEAEAAEVAAEVEIWRKAPVKVEI